MQDNTQHADWRYDPRLNCVPTLHTLLSSYRALSYCRSITNICTEATLQYPHSIVVPVVHEDVRGPDGAGREPEVLHVTVLCLIPPQVVVRPLLKIATLQILVQF